MSDAPFLTLAGTAEAELRVKGSTFLAHAAPADDEDSARAVLALREKTLWDATHHCSAWSLRDGIRRANDHGEPSGSAGAPILAALDGAGLTDAVVVVTRWYGGTKLGVGGLVRAYGDAAAAALEAAPRRAGIPAVRVHLAYGYGHTAGVMRALERAGAEGIEHGYADGGQSGTLEFLLPAAALEPLRDALRDATAGTVAPETRGSAVLHRNAASGSAY
jgi:putative IMPACT (imprinted ancient) family translation regulator